LSSDKTTAGGKMGLRIHPTVFWSTAGVTVFFVIFTLLNLIQMKLIFDASLSFITTSMGWFFVLCVNVYLAVVLYLLFSRHAHIRLGGDDARQYLETALAQENDPEVKEEIKLSIADMAEQVR